jgi:hypothetical protein
MEEEIVGESIRFDRMEMEARGALGVITREGKVESAGCVAIHRRITVWA